MAEEIGNEGTTQKCKNVAKLDGAKKKKNSHWQNK